MGDDSADIWVCNDLVQRALDKERVSFLLNFFEHQFLPLKNGNGTT